MLAITLPLMLFGLLALPAGAAAALPLPATGQTACYDASGSPRECAGTGEDGEKRAGLSWPAPRFRPAGTDAFADLLTGLTWSRHANAPEPEGGACGGERDLSWEQALDFVACLNENRFAGFDDWRLPALAELESMVHAGVADPSAYLIGAGFGRGELATLVQPSGYWSSTAAAGSAGAAWEIDLRLGDFPFPAPKLPLAGGLDTKAVWPVRGLADGPAQVTDGSATVCRGPGGTVPCPDDDPDGDDDELFAAAPSAAPLARFKAEPGGRRTLDRLTGLIWSTAGRTPGPAAPLPPGCVPAGIPLEWQQALDHVACLGQSRYLGTADWRLPNRTELLSLADHSRSAPALPDGHPFADLGKGEVFWTSTSDAGRPSRAWSVSMVDGALIATAKKGAGILAAWPVSGPDLVPPALSTADTGLRINRASRTIAGSVEEGADVTVALNGAPPQVAQVSGSAWSFAVTGLSAGTNTLTVSASDFSENLTSATVAIEYLVPDGRLVGAEEVTVADALKALRIVVGLDQPTEDQMLRGDVAPPGAPDGVIELADTLRILRKAVGLESF